MIFTGKQPCSIHFHIVCGCFQGVMAELSSSERRYSLLILKYLAIYKMSGLGCSPMGWRTYGFSSLLTRAVGLVHDTEPWWAMRNVVGITDMFQRDSQHHFHSEERWEVLQQGPQCFVLANKVPVSIYASGPHTTHRTKRQWEMWKKI